MTSRTATTGNSAAPRQFGDRLTDLRTMVRRFPMSFTANERERVLSIHDAFFGCKNITDKQRRFVEKQCYEKGIS